MKQVHSPSFPDYNQKVHAQGHQKSGVGNGMLETLADVVAFYNAGGGENEFADNKSALIQPLGLTDPEMSDLVAFLESLSGDEILPIEPDVPEMEPLPIAANN